MQLAPIAALKRPMHRFALALSRKRARRRLHRTLAGFTKQQLAELLSDAGIRRSDLFANFNSHPRHRRLMGEMLARFGVDRETACAYHWDELVEAETACAQCPNADKCRRWLAWGRNNGAPNVFCRNAGRFTQMRLNLGSRRSS